MVLVFTVSKSEVLLLNQVASSISCTFLSLNNFTLFSTGQDGENVPWLSVSDIAPRGPSPGMLDITDLMGGGQAIGGVVGDGVSAGK